MNKMVGRIFIVFGVFFLIFSFVLYQVAGIKGQFAMVYNIILLILDCMWLFAIGGYFVIAGAAILKGGLEQFGKIEFGGYLLIFTIVFGGSSFVFNSVAEPIFHSNGRIFTYFLQIFPRLIKPTFSLDFFVPLGSILIFGVVVVWFKRVFMKKIT